MKALAAVMALFLAACILLTSNRPAKVEAEDKPIMLEGSMIIEPPEKPKVYGRMDLYPYFEI